MKLLWCLVLTIGLMVGALGFAQRSSTRLEGILLGAGNDKGKAKWSTKDGRGQMQAEFEVEGENLIPNETYFIYVGKNLPWSATTDAFGAFALEQRYIGPVRPTILPGDSVFVTNEAGTSTLLGTLRAR